MSKGQTNRGGINVGRVGRDMTVNAGGDIVAGDKITKTIENAGFRTADEKASFHEQLAHIEQALRDAKGHIEASNALEVGEKDGVAVEILEQLRLLREASKQTTALAAGEKPPLGVVKRVEAGLVGATTLMEKIQAIVSRGGELAEKLSGIVSSFAPLVLSVRHLFGLS